jgi:hypothetical protein
VLPKCPLAARFVGGRADGFASAHATYAPRTGRSHSFAGQLAVLLHPTGELSFLELVVLVDITALGAGLLTPPLRPTEGLPSLLKTRTPPTLWASYAALAGGGDLRSAERRGQETRAEREGQVTRAERDPR